MDTFWFVLPKMYLGWISIQPCKTLLTYSMCLHQYKGYKAFPKIILLFFSRLSLRLLRSSSVRKLSIWYPTSGRLDMRSASGRTLLSPARTPARVHLTLEQTSTSLAPVGTTSKASLRAKQTL